jgi:hypothetical protein
MGHPSPKLPSPARQEIDILSRLSLRLLLVGEAGPRAPMDALPRPCRHREGPLIRLPTSSTFPPSLPQKVCDTGVRAVRDPLVLLASENYAWSCWWFLLLLFKRPPAFPSKLCPTVHLSPKWRLKSPLAIESLPPHMPKKIGRLKEPISTTAISRTS